MSAKLNRENVDVVREAHDAMNRREMDRYLSRCTDDVVLWAPIGPAEGAYEGREGVRRYFADVADAAPDFRLDAQRLDTVGEGRVIGFLRVSAPERSSGIPTDLDLTTVYDLAGHKISRIRVFLDRGEALRAVGLTE